jgi:hypothetical protein
MKQIILFTVCILMLSTVYAIEPIWTVIFLDPLNGASITRPTNTSSLTVTVQITDYHLDKCWYNHLNSSGFLTTNVLFNCTSGINSFDIPSIDYYGTHNLIVYVNDTSANIGQANITVTIQAPVVLGGGGGSGEKQETPIPFFLREKTPDKTCSVDADQDGILCDVNEDWISCPDDCSAPNLDNLLCFKGSGCVWREAWFLKLLFAMMLIITLYLLYTDYSSPPRQRKVFG